MADFRPVVFRRNFAGIVPFVMEDINNIIELKERIQERIETLAGRLSKITTQELSKVVLEEITTLSKVVGCLEVVEDSLEQRML